MRSSLTTPQLGPDWITQSIHESAQVLDNLRVPLSASLRRDRPGPFPYCGANGVLDYIDDYMIDDDVVLLAEDGGNFEQFRSRPIAYRMKGKIWVNNHAHVLKAARSGDTGYLFYALEHKDIRPYISSSTRSKLTRGELLRIEITRPRDIAEQRRIATALADADSLISALERLIAKKEAIKQGMMQQLLTGTTRLPGFAGPWKDRSIGSLGTSYGGLVGKAKDDFGEGPAQYIPFMAVMAEVRVTEESLLRVRVAKGERQNAVRIDDLLFNASSETSDELAMCAVAGELPADTYLNSFCFGFRLFPADTADSLFLAYMLRSTVGRQLINTLAQGAIRYNLSRSQFRNVVVTIPTVGEQRAIARVLDEADSDIGALRDRLAKAKAIKLGMMQELLTGRTRLPVIEKVAA